MQRVQCRGYSAEGTVQRVQCRGYSAEGAVQGVQCRLRVQCRGCSAEGTLVKRRADDTGRCKHGKTMEPQLISHA